MGPQRRNMDFYKGTSIVVIQNLARCEAAGLHTLNKGYTLNVSRTGFLSQLCML